MTTTPLTPDQIAEADAYCLGVLSAMIELGTELARALQANALRQAAVADTLGEPVPDGSMAAFDRVVRCVRRTVLLFQHVAHPKPQRAGPAPPRRAAIRKQVARAVADSIGREADTDEQAERLHREAMERLDAREFEDDIAAGRPVAEMVGEVVRDLGLAASHPGVPPAMRRTPEDVAALCAWAAAPPGTPARDLPPLRPPRAWGGLVLDHPDDRIEYAEMTDAQLAAAMVREEARKRLHGSG